jgi:hypothetical protein
MVRRLLDAILTTRHEKRPQLAIRLLLGIRAMKKEKSGKK